MQGGMVIDEVSFMPFLCCSTEIEVASGEMNMEYCQKAVLILPKRQRFPPLW
jgi:hypothetical protein